METDWKRGTVTQLVTESAKTFSDKIYIKPYERSLPDISYRDLENFCCFIDGYLDKQGISHGESVVVDLDNSTLMALLFIAIPFSGRVFVPVHPSYKDVEVGHVIETCEATSLITDQGRRDMLQKVRTIDIGDHVAFIAEALSVGNPGDYRPAAVIAPDTPAEIVFTSGSSGLPKGILLSHANLLANAYTLITRYAVTGDDVMLTTIPLAHVGGQTFTTLGPLWVGASTTIVSPDIGLINFWTIVERFGVSWSIVMAAFMNGLLRRRIERTPETLKGLLSGGSSVSKGLITEFERRFEVPVYQVYGQTEMTSTVVSELPEDASRVVGSAGKPHLGTDVKIVTDDGSEAGIDESGEIWLSGPTRFIEYANNAPLTQKKTEGAFVKTGDCGFFDRKGNLHVVGRLDDMMIIGGENIYPSEIENRANEVDWIEHAIACSVPHDILGEQILLVYRCKDNCDEDTPGLFQHLRRNLSQTKIPRNKISLHELELSDWPRIQSGKIDKKHVVERARDYWLKAVQQ